MEQALFMVVGVVSTIFVGRLGKEAISAVGLANALTNFILVFFTALSTGCTVLVARLIGEEDIIKAKNAVKQSMLLAAVSSLLISAPLYVFSKQVLNLFFGSAEAEVLNLAVTYFRITLYTFPLALLNIIISGTLRGAGDTRTPMYIAYMANIVNTASGWVLIFGIDFLFLRFRGFGIAGAALAVALSRGIGGILSVLALLSPRNIIQLDVKRKFYVDFDLLHRIFRVGFPAAMEQAVMQGGFLVLQMVIAGMGTVAIAVYQIGMSINSISFIPIWGFGIAATTLIGQGLGARRPDLAEKCGWETLKISIALNVLLTMLIFIFSRQLVSIYSSDPEVLKTGAAAIRIFSLSQPFLTVVVVLSGALRGAGDILYVMVTSFVGIWMFRIFLTALLSRFSAIGAMGVWIALCFDFFARSLMYLARFKRGRWKEITV